MGSPTDSRPDASGQPWTTSREEIDLGRKIERLFPVRRAARILVVDDHPGIAGLMNQLLSARGYDVVTASDAEQGETEVRRQLPDLILSDVKMPGKSGYDFCREL